MTSYAQNYIVTPIPILKDNYVWTIIDNNTHAVIVIDPGVFENVDHFLKENNYTLSAILITHHHWDHTNGVAELKERYQVPVYGPIKDNISELTNPLRDKDKVEIEQFPLTFDAMGIGGHTLGHIAYLSDGMLFCGDTLFAAGCGRIFEGTAKQMYETLQKIAALPEETKVYPGHEYTLNNLRFAEMLEPDNEDIKSRIKAVSQLRKANSPSLPSTIREEKITNPFLRCDNSTIKKRVEEYAGLELKTTIDVFTWLRKWKDNF